MKRVAPPRIYFWPQDSIEDYSPTWHGSAVTMNKTTVMLGADWKEPSVPLGVLRVKQSCIYIVLISKYHIDCMNIKYIVLNKQLQVNYIHVYLGLTHVHMY